MDRQLLSIGIPTRNRKNAVVENSKRTLLGLRGNVPYLVSDNASEDGSQTALRALSEQDRRMKVFSHPEDLGFAGNLASLLERCETPYLLVSSDEDFVLGSALPELSNFLREKRPMFVSSSIKSSFVPHLDRSGKSKRPINMKQIRGSSSYVSGLIFSVELYRDFMRLTSGLENNVFYKLYPQVALAALAGLRSSAYFWGTALTSPSFNLTSEAKEYQSLASRIHQMSAFDQILSSFERSEEEFPEKSLSLLRRHNVAHTYLIIRSAFMNAMPLFSRNNLDLIALDSTLKASLVERIRALSKR